MAKLIAFDLVRECARCVRLKILRIWLMYTVPMTINFFRKAWFCCSTSGKLQFQFKTRRPLLIRTLTKQNQLCRMNTHFNKKSWLTFFIKYFNLKRIFKSLNILLFWYCNPVILQMKYINKWKYDEIYFSG